MRTLTLLILLGLVATSFDTHAQRWKRYRHEAVLGIGATGFLGELGGGDGPARDLFLDLDGGATRYCISGGYRYKLNEIISLRPSLTYGRLYGSDALADNPQRQSRNLSFRSPIVELAALGEVYVIREKVSSRYRVRGIRGALGSSLSAYVFGGVAGFWFNPRAEYNGKWYSLQPLGTEGQGLNGTKKYSRISFSVPVGLGYKFNLSRTFSFSMEFGFRYAFTDYLDDVSTRYYDGAAIAAANGADGAAAAYFANPGKVVEAPDGKVYDIGTLGVPGEQRGDPSTNDTYMFAVLSLNYKFVSKKRNKPKF